MKTKLIVVIVIILILSGCTDSSKDNTNTKIALPPEIAKTATSEAYISHKKDKLIYTKPEGVYLYIPSTKENKFLISSTSINSETDIWIDGWSPDDKYIILDIGSYIERGKIVVDSQTDKVIAQFDTLDYYAWIIPEEIVFTDLQLMKPPFPRPYMGSAYGIAIINIITGEKVILKQATKTENYTLIKLTKENNILFYKTLYQPIKPEEFKYGKEETSYWIMDKDGKNEKQVEYKNNKWQVIK